MIHACLAMVLAGPPGLPVDRIVAVVDKVVLTHSELLWEARVALALREGGEAATSELRPELLEAFRDYVIDQLLVAAQARRLGGVEVSGEEERRAVAQFAERFRSEAAHRSFLARFGLSQTVVANILRRNLRNEKYIAARRRLWGLAPGVEGSGKQRADEHLRRWLLELREAAEIRLPGNDGSLERQ